MSKRYNLLPCPFCGGPAKMISTMGEWSKGGYGPDGSRVVCADLVCPTHGRVFHGDNQEAQAIAAWNRRAGPEVAGLVVTEAMRNAFYEATDITREGTILNFDDGLRAALAKTGGVPGDS